MADRVNSLLAELRGCGETWACGDCKRGNSPELCQSLVLDAADALQEYVDRCKRYADEIMALRERVRQGLQGENYFEAWALWNYCKRQDIPVEIESLFDGWKLVFPNGDDIVQHAFSYMGTSGALESAIGCEDDFSPVTLEEAKVLVLKHRQRLMVPRAELPDKPEVSCDDA